MYFIKADCICTPTWKVLGIVIDYNAKKPEDLPKKLTRPEVLEKFGAKLIDDESLYVEAVRTGVFIIFSEKLARWTYATHATLSSAATAIISRHRSEYWRLPMYMDWRDFSAIRDEVTFYKKATALGIAWNHNSIVSQLSYDRQLNNAQLVQQLRVKTERLSHIVPVFMREDQNSLTFMIDGESYTIDHASSEAMRTLACIASNFKKGRQ